MIKLSIGKLSKAVNISIYTIRYYETLGLLAPEKRTRAGYRIYNQDSINRLEFIGKAQHLGFSLDEIKGLLKLRKSAASKCNDIKKQVEEKIALIKIKEAKLNKIKNELKSLEATCINNNDPAAECPILEKLYPRIDVKEQINE